MSPIYTVELYVDKNPVVLEFEILDRRHRINHPSNMTADQHIAWNSMFINEFPLQVHSIDGEPIEDGYAFAYTLKTGYCGTVLTGIRLNNVSYKSDVYNEYWFPGTEKPEELDDGCVEIHLVSKEIIYANPSAKPPFMDLSGKFIEEYEVVYTQPLNSHFDASIQIINEEFCRILSRSGENEVFGNLNIHYCVRYNQIPITSNAYL